MDRDNSLSHFIEMEIAIADSLESAFAAARRAARSGLAIARTYLRLTAATYIILFLLIIAPKVWVIANHVGRISLWLGANPGGELLLFLFGVLYLSIMFALWVGVAALPFSLASKKVAASSSRLLFIQAVLIIPISFFGMNELINYIIGMPVSEVGSSRNFVLALILTTYLLSSVLCYVIVFVSSSLSGFMILLLSASTPLKSFTAMPTYDHFIRHGIDQCAPLTQTWTAAQTQQVYDMARLKLDSLAAQVQTIAPILGSIGLFSLTALIVTQYEIQRLMRNVNGFLNEITYGANPIDVEFVVVLLLLLIIVVGCLYFVRVYKTMRILEILGMLCTIRLADLKAEQEVADRAVRSARRSIWSWLWRWMK